MLGLVVLYALSILAGELVVLVDNTKLVLFVLQAEVIVDGVVLHEVHFLILLNVVFDTIVDLLDLLHLDTAIL